MTTKGIAAAVPFFFHEGPHHHPLISPSSKAFIPAATLKLSS